MPVANAEYIYFTRLSLENVKSFGDRQQLNLTDRGGKPARWTLILGENGVGKTTLLQCLALMRPILTLGEGTKTNSGKPDLLQPALYDKENSEIAALARTGQPKVSIEADLSIGRLFGDARGRSRPLTLRADFEMKENELDKVLPNPLRRRGFVEPIIIGYGAARHSQYRSSDTLEALSDPTESLFDPSVELADAQAILQSLDYAAYKKQSDAEKLLEALKRALVTLLPNVPSVEAIKLHGPKTPGKKKQKTGVQVVTPYGEVPLHALSLGYQTMTAWAVDLAWRLYQAFPEASEPLKQPAIVLIDELDLHLHPRWQRQLRLHISDAFPNVQFIATAHSPLLAQDYLDANLAVVRECDGQAIIDDDPEVVRTWRLDEVVTSALYEVESPYSLDVQQDLDRRTALLQKSSLTESEVEELARLEAFADTLSTRASKEDEQAMDVIRRAAMLLGAKTK